MTGDRGTDLEALVSAAPSARLGFVVLCVPTVLAAGVVLTLKIAAREAWARLTRSSTAT